MTLNVLMLRQKRCMQKDIHMHQNLNKKNLMKNNQTTQKKNSGNF